MSRGSLRALALLALATAFCPAASAAEEPVFRALQRPVVDRRPRVLADEILIRFSGGLAPGHSDVVAVESALDLTRIRYNSTIAIHRY